MEPSHLHLLHNRYQISVSDSQDKIMVTDTNTNKLYTCNIEAAHIRKVQFATASQLKQAFSMFCLGSPEQFRLKIEESKPNENWLRMTFTRFILNEENDQEPLSYVARLYEQEAYQTISNDQESALNELENVDPRLGKQLKEIIKKKDDEIDNLRKMNKFMKDILERVVSPQNLDLSLKLKFNQALFVKTQNEVFQRFPNKAINSSSASMNTINCTSANFNTTNCTRDGMTLIDIQNLSDSEPRNQRPKTETETIKTLSIPGKSGVYENEHLLSSVPLIDNMSTEGAQFIQSLLHEHFGVKLNEKGNFPCDNSFVASSNDMLIS